MRVVVPVLLRKGGGLGLVRQCGVHTWTCWLYLREVSNDYLCEMKVTITQREGKGCIVHLCLV